MQGSGELVASPAAVSVYGEPSPAHFCRHTWL
jgi:hypothetical protein